jgi:hypothetical protein
VKTSRSVKSGEKGEASACSKKASHNTESTEPRTTFNSSSVHPNLPGTVVSFNSQQPTTITFPMKPSEAIRFYSKWLTDFEKTEI